MKVYTRRGDAGQTDLFGGDRVSKSSARVDAYGEVDELNACIGVAAAASEQVDLRADLQRIQNALFDLGSYLATPSAAHREKAALPEIDASEIAWLEGRIDALEEELTPLKNFILPGGSSAAAALHLARTVCRRAERRSVDLDAVESLEANPLAYLNRLSDLLFVMARAENRRAGVDDVEWGAR